MRYPGNDIVPAVSQPIVASSAPLDFVLIIGWIYLFGVLIFLIRSVISLISTYRIISAGVTVSVRFPRIVVSARQHPPFSFFPYAVIPSSVYNSGNYTDILDHESAHLRQGHTFDLLLSEIFIAFQWFNPFAWLIKRSVVLNHEYLADQVSVINRSIKDYQYRLLSIAGEVKAVSLAHTFNSLIKNRIIMINTKPTNSKAVWKTLIVLPPVLILSYAFVKPEYKYVSS
ncbi:MAG: M56 family metallopeptidase [Bacteroidetes bacterium]|nr:M56 family metallopeptidase [Bacteroidota bacterium]